MRFAKTLMTMATSLHNLLCALPLLCVATLYALVGRAAMLLGYWPRFLRWCDYEAAYRAGNDDRVYLSLSHGMDWLIASTILSVPLWLIFTICLRGRYSLAERWGRVALYSLGWLACVAVVAFDPSSCFKWFMD